MVRHTFNSYRGRASIVFTCPSCGGINRRRGFVEEHTVNPFNKNADGSVKQAAQVQADARAAAILARARFAAEPLCKSCEDALTTSDRHALHNRRRAAIAGSVE